MPQMVTLWLSDVSGLGKQWAIPCPQYPHMCVGRTGRNPSLEGCQGILEAQKHIALEQSGAPAAGLEGTVHV